MTTSKTTHLQRASELYQAGNIDEALAELYIELWNNTHNPEVHLLLWDILEAQRQEQERLERLKDVIHNPIRPAKSGSPVIPFAQAKPFTRPREAPRISVSKSVILVGYDIRNRFFAELITIEDLSRKGATLTSNREVRIGDQVHLFSTSGLEEETVVALVRNTRLNKEDQRRRIGIEFLKKPGKWLVSDEIVNDDLPPSDEDEPVKQ